MEKKEISSRTTIKAIITGFVSYGIITMFVSFLLIAFGNNYLNMFTGKQVNGLYITIPLMVAITIYFVIHGICRISTYDVFKKCKTNPENYKDITKYLNLFFIFCVILTIILFSTMLYYNLEYQVKYIELYKLQFRNVYPEDYINNVLSADLISTYNASKVNLIRGTVILVTGVAISFLSLINYQKKMITRYNEF
jgi:hypothetical protein